MATLNLYGLTLAYSDITVPGNNPGMRNVDWKREQQGISVKKPSNVPYELSAGLTIDCFDGSRSLTVDATTSFDLKLSLLGSDLYRLQSVAGTSPGFRTKRSTAVTGLALTTAAPGNGTLTLTAASGSPFAAVVAGDELMIPGPMTGDGSTPFSVLNQGRWTVIAASAAFVTLVRPAGQDFQGVAEAVTPSSEALSVYSSAGVQPGDKMKLISGFSAQSLRTFTVESVTDSYVEFRSNVPLAEESSVEPTAAGIAIYTNCKRFVQIEADQECELIINGVSGATLSPWCAGDPKGTATYMQVGPVYSLSVKNNSLATANVLVITAE